MRQDGATSLVARVTLDDIVQRLGFLEAGDEQRRLIDDSLNLVDHEEFFRRLAIEKERLLNDQPLLALRYAEALLWAAARADRPDHFALGLLAKGDALQTLGRFQDAVLALDQAADLFSIQSDEIGWARSRLGALWPMHRLGRNGEALPVATRALEILVARQEWLRAGNSAIFLARVYADLARHDEALELYGRAAEYYGHLGLSTEIQIGYVKAHRAQLLNRRGDFRAALRLHQEARDIYVRHGQRVLILQEDQFIAYSYAGQGHYTQALQLYGDVLAAHEATSLDPEVALVALDMAACYLELNRYADALALGEDAVSRSERCRAPIEVAKARLLCALALARLGASETALRFLDEVGPAFIEAGFSRQLGIATLLRATLYFREANWSSAFSEAKRAQALFAERALVIDQARSELLRARAALALGQPDEASFLARSALGIAAERELPWLAFEGHHVLGKISQSAGAPDVALVEYDRAITSVESMQSRLPSVLRTSFLEDKLQVYHDAIECSLNLGNPDQALAYLERAKSRALVDYLAGNPDVRTRARSPANQELADQLARLREEHAWLYNRVYGDELGRRPEDEPSEAERRELEGRIRDRERSIARLVERLVLHDASEIPAHAAPAVGQRPELPSLEDGTVLVEYYFGNGGGAAFVQLPKGVKVVSLATGPDLIRRRLSRLQLNFETTARALSAGQPITGLAANARNILQELYQDLIQPVEAYLVGRERLVVVPFGPTHGVPFHALYDGERYLLETKEVSVWPSSSLLRLSSRQRPRGQRALVVGYSDGGRLPHVLEEAQAVAALMPGDCFLEEAATRAGVIGAAPGCRVLHLATHGEARLDNPTFAYLKLADGQLSAVDVFNLKLEGALITLSACETGRSVVVGGDEVIGLSRGFLYAGASTLVQSLWRVEDGSTARLMQRFYRTLVSGQPKGTALREAQRASLADDGPHPYFWAPFQLIGDSGPL